MTPAEVKSERDVLTLHETAMFSKEFWIHVAHNGEVCIHRQRKGEPSTEAIHIPRRDFARVVDWYLKEQGASLAMLKPDGATKA